MNTKTFITWCLALLAVGITAQSCKNKTEEEKAGEQSLLMVERQQVELKVDEESYPLSFTVDVPVSGPQVLTDSLKAFLNFLKALQNVTRKILLYLLPGTKNIWRITDLLSGMA